MSDSNHQSDPLSVTLNLPPDGTHPSRIVSPGNSTWLRAGADPQEILDGIYIANIDGQCVVYRETDQTAVNINHDPLTERHVLTDGDFIHSDAAKALFQADPVADYRAEWAANPQQPERTLYPSRRLRQDVVAAADGLSFDGGRTTARWDEIIHLAVTHAANANTYGVQIVTDDAVLPLAYGDPILSKDEIDTLLGWAAHAAPFHLSLLSPIAMNFADAYYVLVHDKLLIPANEGSRTLPRTPAFVLDLATRSCVLIQMAVRVAVAVLVGIVVAALARPTLGNTAIYAGILVFLAALAVQGMSFRGGVQHLQQLARWESFAAPPE